MTFNISVSGAIFDIFEYDSWDELMNAIDAKAAEYPDTFDMNRWAQVDDIPYDEKAHQDREPLFGKDMRIWVKAMLDSYEHVNRMSRKEFFDNFVPFVLWLRSNASNDYSDAYDDFVDSYQGDYNSVKEFAQEQACTESWYKELGDLVIYFDFDAYWEGELTHSFNACIYEGKQYIYAQ